MNSSDSEVKASEPGSAGCNCSKRGGLNRALPTFRKKTGLILPPSFPPSWNFGLPAGVDSHHGDCTWDHPGAKMGLPSELSLLQNGHQETLASH